MLYNIRVIPAKALKKLTNTISTSFQDDSWVIAVVIPAYRAAGTIEKVLLGIPTCVNHIIVVDDCSPDNLAEIVTKRTESDHRIHLVRHTTNQGVGGAMITGYQAVLELGADIIIKMDSDNQMDPAYVSQLILPIQTGKADYTKGNRFLHGKDLLSMPLIRRIGNSGLSFLTKLASGYWNIFDPANGFTALRAALVSRINWAKIDHRFFFESSLLLELGLQRAVVKDIYIPARYGDEKSSLSVVNTLFRFPPLLLRGFLRRIFLQYFIRDFTPVSLLLLVGMFLVLFGGGFGILKWAQSSRMGVPATTGTVMIAVLPFILGVQMLLQAAVLDIQTVPQDILDETMTNTRET